MTPEWIGPYKVQSSLGAGGMGSVYLALNSEGQTVAVKVMHPSLQASSQGVLRLKREVAAMQRLTGPLVAEIMDADLDQSPPYIVSRYVQGRSLEDLVRERGPLTGTDLHRLATGLVRALEVIHAAGVVTSLAHGNGTRRPSSTGSRLATRS